jgi:hypothetical protein
MGDDKKVFLRIGAMVCAIEGVAGRGSTAALIVPILSEKLAMPLHPPRALMEALAILVDTRRSVDQYLAPITSEIPIRWNHIEIEGVGEKDDGDRATLPAATSKQILLNSFGPTFRNVGDTGVMSLELSFFQRHQKEIEAHHTWPYEKLSPAQCLSVLYAKDAKDAQGAQDPRSGKRYVGFQARVVKKLGVDNKITIEILESSSTKVQRTCEIEATKIDECDFDIDLPEVLGRRVTRIERTSAPGEVGGIFLEARFAASLALVGDPKTPFYQ